MENRRGDVTDHFFAYQRRMLGILLAWGLGNMLLGVLAWAIRDPLVRQFGVQALVWGAIDAALALFGRRSARRKAAAYERGDLDNADMLREAANMRRILLVNAGLDVGYIVGGVWVMRRFHARRDRRGMGLGILVQGAFLLVYDSLLARDISRRWIPQTQRYSA